MKLKLHLDFETFSTVDIKSGIHNYVACEQFEILCVSFAIERWDGSIVSKGVYPWNDLPIHILGLIQKEDVKKCSHNATFERHCLLRVDIPTDISEWECSMVKAAYCGLPLALESVAKALNLEVQKLATGKRLIKLFCTPQLKKGVLTRVYPKDQPEKFQELMDYCLQDTLVEVQICKALSYIVIPPLELEHYELDQRVNDRGIKVDLELANAAIRLNEENVQELTNRALELTGSISPTAVKKLLEWLNEEMDEDAETVTNMQKATVANLLTKTLPDHVTEILQIRQDLSKTSISKYQKLISYAGKGQRARGLLQFYGASRTGRWAGRGVQIHNLTKHFVEDLGGAIDTVKNHPYWLVKLMYGSVASLLSQLIRPLFVASGEDRILAVVDYSAIEARVLAWLAGETWRIKSFEAGLDIYKVSVSVMLNIPIEEVTSEMRSKRGKVSELALGYEGGVNALINMGGEKLGLSHDTMKQMVKDWRQASPKIVAFWKSLNEAAINAILYKGREFRAGFIKFKVVRDFLVIELPNKRCLHYYKPSLIEGRFGGYAVQYMGQGKNHGSWVKVDSYGGKFCENVTQAVARDILAEAMLRLDRKGFEIVSSVHDEIIVDLPIFEAQENLEIIRETMIEIPSWAEGLPLNAVGFLSSYYKKD